MTDPSEQAGRTRRGLLAGAAAVGADSSAGRLSKAVQLTGQQIQLENSDIVCAQVELLLDQGFDTIEIRGVRFVGDKPEPYLSPLEAEARAAEAWYAAHVDVAAPKDKHDS
jgi:hypothetical protein